MTGLLLHIYKVCVSFGLVEITTFFIKKNGKLQGLQLLWDTSQQPELHTGGGKV